MTKPLRRSPKPDLFKAAELSGSEHSHQVALFSWANDAKAEYPELRWMFAIPNGGHRSKSQAAMLKAEGLKAGVLDILLPVPKGRWLGLWVEMKRPPKGKDVGGKLTPEQETWAEYFKSIGYGVAVCRTYEEARETIVQYLTWRGL